MFIGTALHVNLLFKQMDLKWSCIWNVHKKISQFSGLNFGVLLNEKVWEIADKIIQQKFLVTEKYDYIYRSILC